MAALTKERVSLRRGLLSFLRHRRVGLGFIALCLLAGSDWIVQQALPDGLPGLTGIAIRMGCLALILVLAGRGSRASAGRLAVWGAVLLVGLPAAFAGAKGRVSALTEMLVLGLIPAAVVFVEAQRDSSFGTGRDRLRMLAPALVGVGGLGLVIPYSIPSSGLGLVWLALMLVAAFAAGLAIIRIHALLRGVGIVRGAGSVCGGAALAAGVIGATGWGAMEFSVANSTGALVRLLIDACEMLLTVWLLREMRPTGFSARYIAVLLVTVVESFVLVRPGITWTIATGLIAAAGACWVLLQEPADALDR